MARTKQTARMATPRGAAAQLRWHLAQQCALAGEAEGAPVAKRKRVHWADDHETPADPLNPRKRPALAEPEADADPDADPDARSPLLDVLAHLAEALRRCLRADGTDVTTLFGDYLGVEACLRREPHPLGGSTWALSPPGLVRFAEHAPRDQLRAALDDLEAAGAGLAATYAYLDCDFAAFDEDVLPDPRALALARAIHAGALATWPQLCGDSVPSRGVAPGP